MHNPFQNAQEQFDKVTKYLDITPDILAVLREPQKILEVSVPVRMDSGKVRIFKGFRSQHNNALGPYKGGIRFHQNVTKEEIVALSMWMTWKCAVAGIPFGGGKGGVVVNPKQLSEGELERLSRGYVRAIAPMIGPETDVPAPDVGTGGREMAWMVEEYEKCQKCQKCQKYQKYQRYQKNKILAAFTGKPVELGGSLGRTEATGRGGVCILNELAKKLGKKSETLKIAVQGMGNVGYWFAQLAHEQGYKIVALSDSKGGIKLVQSSKFNTSTSSALSRARSRDKMQSLDPQKVMEWKKKTGSVVGFPGSTSITNDQLLITDCDILVPAAMENVIDAKNARKIKAWAVVEMANGPTTPEADEILAKKKIIVVPDILANAGGVTVSYFEWFQNMKNQKWTEGEVNKKLKRKMKNAFEEIWKVSQEKKVDLRKAAYILAVDKVAKAM